MIPFVKMQGIGNDFVIVDALRSPLPLGDVPAFSKKVCDRRFGVGADGLIIIEPGEAAPFRMRMFNPDGSESEMCGNGIRCFARLLRLHGHLSSDRVNVETGAGILDLQLLDSNLVKVAMGPASFLRGEIGMTGDPADQFVEQPVGHGLLGTAVSMGNPHLVIFVQDVASVPLELWGPELEHFTAFPQRTNVHFAQVLDSGHIRQRTWERGAGITLACGTGACSVAAAGNLTGRTGTHVQIDLPGGSLDIDLHNFQVSMTGPAEISFTGQICEILER